MEIKSPSEWETIVRKEWAQENKYAPTAAIALANTSKAIADNAPLGTFPVSRQSLEVIAETLGELYAARIKRDEELAELNK